MEIQAIKLKILREKYVKNMLNDQLLRAKKYFMKLKDRELKDREEKTKREIIISKDDMDKSEELEIHKIRPIIRFKFA